MADEILTRLQKEVGRQTKELERIESKLDENVAQLRLEIKQLSIDMRKMFKQLGIDMKKMFMQVMIKIDPENTSKAVMESLDEELKTKEVFSASQPKSIHSATLVENLEDSADPMSDLVSLKLDAIMEECHKEGSGIVVIHNNIFQSITRFFLVGYRFGYVVVSEKFDGVYSMVFMTENWLVAVEKHLATRFNKLGNDIMDHCTYVILGDDCQMEGISNEACSLLQHCCCQLHVEEAGVFDKFYGEGRTTLPLADYASIANMSLEYNAPMKIELRHDRAGTVSELIISFQLVSSTKTALQPNVSWTSYDAMECTMPQNAGGEIATFTPILRKPRILLGACGSVAAIKFEKLCHCFCGWAEVKAVATKASLRFIDRASLPTDVNFYTDEEEWSSWQKIGDNVLHIELCRWADIMVIAPLSANTLGKMAGGLCDNLLTCIVRAWDYSKPLFVAPSMNTLTWSNPFTERHLMSIDELGACLIPPLVERQASGDYSKGAMAETSVIHSTIRIFLESRPIRRSQ
ncbi:hypothetical protein DITRI_Ditri03aG0205600 [Diplodiscus trichospermus]